MRFATEEMNISPESAADMVRKAVRDAILEQIENEATLDDVVIGISAGIENILTIMAALYEWSDDTLGNISKEVWKSIACQIDPSVRITINLN